MSNLNLHATHAILNDSEQKCTVNMCNKKKRILIENKDVKEENSWGITSDFPRFKNAKVSHRMVSKVRTR